MYHMPGTMQMPHIRQVTSIQHKSTPLPVYDTKITDIEHIPANNWKRKKWPSYET